MLLEPAQDRQCGYRCCCASSRERQGVFVLFTRVEHGCHNGSDGPDPSWMLLEPARHRQCGYVPVLLRIVEHGYLA